MAKINSRSPYFISSTGVSYVEVKVWIYDGIQTTDRDTNPNYTFVSNAVNGNTTIDIGQIVQDYAESGFDGDYETENYWVDYEVKECTSSGCSTPVMYQNRSFNGYGYFEEGANPQLSQSLLQSNDTVVKLDDSELVIPVDTSLTSKVTYTLKDEVVYTKTISSSTQSNEQIEYVVSASDSYSDFEQRIIEDGGILEESRCLREFQGEVALFDFDKVYIESTDGSVSVVSVDNIQECTYEPIKLTFVNKFGALQDLWFFKTHSTSLSTQSEEYRSNLISNGTYETYEHQYRTLFKSGKESIK